MYAHTHTHTHTHTHSTHTHTHTESPGTRYGESVTEFQSTSIVQISRNGQNSAARVGQYFLLFCFSIAEMSGKRSSLIEFKRIGIGPKNGENTAGWKLKTLGTLIHEEGLEDVSSRCLLYTSDAADES